MGHCEKCMFWKKRRVVVGIVFFFGFFIKSCLRSNMSMAVVAMAENVTKTLKNGTVVHDKPEFDWDSTMQGYILSAFFYGYTSTHILGGYLASRFGGKRVFGIGICITSIFTGATPWTVRISDYSLIAFRVIEGGFEGVTDPCIYHLLSNWAPPLERSRLLSFTLTGNYVGTIVTFPLSGYLNKTLGWPAIFYFFAALGLVWTLILCITVAETPARDSRISEVERQYIEDSLHYSHTNLKIKHPWKKIFSSVPVWALIATNFCESWGYYTLLTLMPKYMKDTLNFDLAKAGYVSALPYTAMAIIIPASAQIADWLLQKDLLTVTQVRRLFTYLCSIPPAIFLVVGGFLNSSIGTVVCLILTVGLSGTGWPGYMVNFLDIAPQHAGVVSGISFTINNFAGVLSPTVAGHIVTTPSAEEWRIMFYITSGLYLLGCIIFGVFGTGETQPWAMESDQELSDSRLQQ